MTKEEAINVIESSEIIWARPTKEEKIALSMAIEALKKQKTGKWIVHTEIKNAYGGIYIECSECGERYVVQHLDDEIFCRTCGARMECEEE